MSQRMTLSAVALVFVATSTRAQDAPDEADICFGGDIRRVTEAIAQVPGDQRPQRLVQTLECDSSDLSYWAAVTLARNGHGALLDEPLKALSTWTDLQKRGLLQELQIANDFPNAARFARVFIKAADGPCERDGSIGCALDVAASTLAIGGNVSDAPAVLQALQIDSNSPALWIAAVRLGALDSSWKARAKKLASDPVRPELLRMAAGLASGSAEASEGLIERVDELTQSFASRPNAVPESDARSLMHNPDYVGDLQIIGLTRFLPEDRALPLLGKCAASPDSNLRMFAGLIVSQQWPQSLEAVMNSLSSEEQSAVLGLSTSTVGTTRAKVTTGGSRTKSSVETENRLRNVAAAATFLW